MSGGGGGEATLEFTPTWVVAIVCMAIVAISLAVERLIHHTGLYLKKNDKKPLYRALQKIKEELMLVGFISLLLTVFQGRIGSWCISEDLANKMLPCEKVQGHRNSSSTAHHTATVLVHVAGRHLLSENSDLTYCQKKGKVPLLSVTALHHLHIFIFVLAATHVVMCALTVFFGGLKIRQWQPWEETIRKKEHDPEDGAMHTIIPVKQHSFIKNRFPALDCALFGWLLAFLKQFYGSVTRSDYTAMRMGFIMEHCRSNPKYDFHKYMVRAFESDFEKVVGISWFLWLLVGLFLFLNVNGYHAYFWLSFIPFVLLLAVGTKLEHIIIQLAQDVAQRYSVIIGPINIHPSDNHFWFHKPRILLLLIHIILFQNSFEMAFFFWIWVQYGFESCIMGSLGYTIPRLVIAVVVQILCSYSTLPLYAIVTQMGNSFNKAIFEDHIHEGLIDWAKSARRATTMPKKVKTMPVRAQSMPVVRPSQEVGGNSSDGFLQLVQTTVKNDAHQVQQSSAGEIQPDQSATTRD